MMQLGVGASELVALVWVVIGALLWRIRIQKGIIKDLREHNDRLVIHIREMQKFIESNRNRLAAGKKAEPPFPHFSPAPGEGSPRRKKAS